MEFLRKHSPNDVGPTLSPAPQAAHGQGQTILHNFGDALREDRSASGAASSTHLAPRNESHDINQNGPAKHTSITSGFDKPLNALSGQTSPHSNATSFPRKDEHLLDKITNAISHSSPPPPQ
ncbi:hypothetical protein H0H92_015667, partial [Tricholoma furcatifolium]